MATTKKSAQLLLIQASRIAKLSVHGNWPSELKIDQLAALMAGEGKGAGYRDRMAMIIGALLSENAADRLTARTVQPPDRIESRPADNLSAQQRFRRPLFESFNGFRERTVFKVAIKQSPIHFLGRRDVADWLHRIGEDPGEYVLAWLGEAWAGEGTESEPGRIREAKEPPKCERRKRSALIAELSNEWPTIEADLLDASRNDLAVAKLAKHGYWDKCKALQWARENGKLRSGDTSPETDGSLRGQLVAAATRKHRMK